MKRIRFGLILIIQWFFFLMMGCVNPNNIGTENTDERDVYLDNQSQVRSKIWVRDSLLRPYDKVSSFENYLEFTEGPYIWEIRTKYMNDTLAYEFAVDSLRTRPIVYNQELIFKKDAVVLNRYKPHINKIKVKNSKGEELNVPDISFWFAFVVRSQNSYFYFLNGTQMCSAGHNCKEFLGIYSVTGEVIYEGKYGDSNNRVQEVLDSLKISESDYQMGMERGKSLDIYW